MPLVHDRSTHANLEMLHHGRKKHFNLVAPQTDNAPNQHTWSPERTVGRPPSTSFTPKNNNGHTSLSCGAFGSSQSWIGSPTVPQTFFATLRRKQCGLQRSVSDSLRLDTNPENGSWNALNVHYRRRGPRYFGPAEDVDTWTFKKNAYHAKHFAILP